MTGTWEGKECNEQPAEHHTAMCERRKVDNLFSELRGQFEDSEKKFYLLNLRNTELVAENKRRKSRMGPDEWIKARDELEAELGRPAFPWEVVNWIKNKESEEEDPK
jgi:hypothetical protein